MHNFAYHRASSLESASVLLKNAEDGRVLAGGMTLIPTLKQRLAAPSDLVDLATVPGISGVRRTRQTLIIGAMSRHADVAAATDVQRTIPALAALAGGIGDPSVRNRGTIGGSVANADPAADYPAGVLGLNAVIETTERSIAADDFFTGMFETALVPGEIIVNVHFPIPDRASYMKFRHPASGYAVVGVMVAQTKREVRVAVTGAGASVFRLYETEEALATDFSVEAIANVTVSPGDLMGDPFFSADYRAHLISVMAKRAVAELTHRRQDKPV